MSIAPTYRDGNDPCCARCGEPIDYDEAECSEEEERSEWICHECYRKEVEPQ